MGHHSRAWVIIIAFFEYRSIFCHCVDQTNNINYPQVQECYPRHVRTVLGRKDNKDYGQQIPQKRLWNLLDWQQFLLPI